MQGSDGNSGAPRVTLWRTALEWRSLLLLGVVAAALIGGIVLMWSTVNVERAQRAQATRTNAVLLALRDISRTATNGETGQRGYFITLDQRYLAPYLAAREQYRPAIARLRHLMREDATPRQRALLDQIDSLSQAKFAELDETVDEIGQGGLLEARRRILTDEGQDVMERLRRSIAELERLELASFETARNRATSAEARIVPTLVVLLVFILIALALGLRQVIRTADAEGRARNAADLAIARDQADLLARELNHRVKNLFAVVLAIVKMTGRDEPAAKPTVDRIAERIHALLVAHEVTQGSSQRASAQLVDLVETVLKPYRSDDNAGAVSGPDISLPERSVVPLGLVLHELTTNSVKYGAWSRPGGHLDVTWSGGEGRLTLDWTETVEGDRSGVPQGKGFGSTLLEGAVRQLGGSVRRDFHASGLTVRIELPLAG